MGKFYEGVCNDLIAYVRAIAFLNAVPAESEQDASRRKQVARRKQAQPERLTRGQMMRAKGEESDIAEVDAGLYLVDYLMEAGPFTYGASGPIPLNWQDFRSWQDTTGIDLQPWEAKTLRRLSAAYLGQMQKAEEIDCPPPWVPVMTETDRAEVSKNVQTALRMLMTTRPKR